MLPEAIVDILPTIIVGSVIVFIIYRLSTRQSRKLEKTFPNIDGPKPWPLIGDLPSVIQAKGQIHLLFDGYYRQYGRLFKADFFGQTGLVISEPGMLREILVKRFDCFYNRPKAFTLPKPLDNILSLVNGEKWKRIRTALSPTFSAHKLKIMVPVINTKCDVLVKKVEEVALTQTSFDILSYQQALTLDVVMSTAFGLDSNSQVNSDDAVLKTVVASMRPGPLMFIANILLPLLPYGERFAFSKLGGRIFFKDMLDTWRLAKDVVDARRLNGTEHKDFLDLMLNAGSPSDRTIDGDKKVISDEEIIAQCVGFLLAGYDTTSTTLALTCYHLASNPDVQERLQQEIDSVWTCEDNMPSYDTVHELPYLDMVISETLRLYPPGFMLLRESTKECTIKDITIPKETPIMIPVYSIHRDLEFFPDPEKFDPERFNATAKQSRDPYTYLPFGQGPRNCIGMRLAQMEMKLVLVRLLKKYSFVIDPGATLPPKLGIKATLTVTDGIFLGVQKRDRN